MQVPPKGSSRHRLHRMVTSGLFECFINACILFNTLTLLTVYYGQPKKLHTFQEVVNHVMTAIFVFECLAKNIALSPPEYFRESWNQFDFVLVLGSAVDIGVLLSGYDGIDTAAFRALRIARLVARALRTVRLVKSVAGLRTIFHTLFQSLPTIMNVTILLALIMFVYGVIAMTVFGEVQYGEALTRRLNFSRMDRALMALFVLATGDYISPIVIDCMVEEPACEPAHCGSFYGAPLFFISYSIIVEMVIIETFMNVVLVHFEEAGRKEDRAINDSDLDTFVKAWQVHDPFATGIVPREALYDIMASVPPPLGFFEHQRAERMIKAAFFHKISMLRYPEDADESTAGSLRVRAAGAQLRMDRAPQPAVCAAGGTVCGHDTVSADVCTVAAVSHRVAMTSAQWYCRSRTTSLT